MKDVTETCREFEIAIDRELAEGVAPAERELLLDHLERCAACSELFDLLTALKSDPVADEPSEHELARMRRQVLAELPAAPRIGAGGARGGVGALGAVGAVGARRWALAAAVGLALIGGGVFLGRTTATPAPIGQVELAGYQSMGSLSPAQLRRAGYRFASAAVEESGAERLRLSFDVARTVEVEVDRNDPLVTEVLVQSLVSPAELGSRLRAVESAAERNGARLDPRIRRALIEVMRRDESVGVRLAAQEKLLATGHDPELVDALIELLEEEESVQMRLAAIDYLTENRVDAGRLTRAIEAGEQGGERALFVHASQYLTGHAPEPPGMRP